MDSTDCNVRISRSPRCCAQRSGGVACSLVVYHKFFIDAFDEARKLARYNGGSSAVADRWEQCDFVWLRLVSNGHRL